VRINDFVIISAGHGKPLQKRVMTIRSPSLRAERSNPESLIMSAICLRHYKRRAWDKSPAKKSDDDTGRRHCERSEAIQEA